MLDHRNNQQSEAVTTTNPELDGFHRLWQLVSFKTKQELKAPSEEEFRATLAHPSLQAKLKKRQEVVDEIKDVVLEFNDNLHVKVDKILGGGHWSFVFLVNKYNPVTHELGDKLVLKMSKPPQKSTNPLKQPFFELSEDFYHINPRSVKEAQLNELYYGFGASKQFEINGKTNTFILIDYQGDYTLKSLLTKPELLKRISLKEWLDFFIDLLCEIDKFHQKTLHIHNDIKPENIALSLIGEDIKTFLVARETRGRYIDFGNCQSPYETAWFGDLRYNPIIESLKGLVFTNKDAKIDIHALGASLLEATEVLFKYHLHPEDVKILERCKYIFSRMTDYPAERISLETGITWLKNCRDDYALVQERKNAELRGEELNKLLLELKEKSKKLNESSSCPAPCIPFSLWHKADNSDPQPLAIRIAATEKMLAFATTGENVDFSEAEFAELQKGKLARIVGMYRLENKLPLSLLAHERGSVPKPKG